MPRLLEESEIKDAAVDAELDANPFVISSGQAPDLTDGGVVNGVRVRPARDRSVTQGRPAARAAWMWNGTATTLPLAWDPDGKNHDGARRFLLKRHCLCCGRGGFKGSCPYCRKAGCANCAAGTDPKKIIPCFYLKKEDVPFPQRFYGSVNCFLPFCPRRDGRGFQTQEDMRMHARSRHRMEYQAHLDTLAANRQDELDYVKQQLSVLLAERSAPPPKPAEPPKAPLYVKEPKEPKK